MMDAFRLDHKEIQIKCTSELLLVYICILRFQIKIRSRAITNINIYLTSQQYTDIITHHNNPT